MEYCELEPSASLRPLVRCYWALTAPANEPASSPEPALPDGSPELIFNTADPFVALGRGGARRVQPLAMLVGQITGPLTVGPTGRVDLIAVRFEPCGASLVCDNLAAITDSWIDVADLPPRELATLRDELARAPDLYTRVSMLDDALTRLSSQRLGPDRDVAEAVRAIGASHGMVVLEELAVRLGCSLRHLQRRFATQVGVSPKLLARIRRFQRVFQAWRDDPRSLSRVAVECGYFDQPHLIHDFRDFAGSAPAAFLANQAEFTQFFLATSPQR